MNVSLANPIEKLLKIWTGSLAYFFNPIDFSSHFPFFSRKADYDFRGYYYNMALPVFFHNESTFGLVNFPVLWLISTAKNVYKTLPKTDAILKNMLLAMLGIGILQIFIVSAIAGVNVRYSVDFMWVFTLSALICAYATYRKFSNYVILKIIYMLCFASIVIVFFLSFTFDLYDQLFYFYKPLLYYFKCVFSIYPG
jgi:hypothetical protein